MELGLTSLSMPLLPQAPAGHGDDRNHALVRAVLEDVATAPLPDDTLRGQLLDVLAAIDSAPVGYRAELGMMWLSWLREVAETPSTMMKWRFRSHIWPDRPYLIFGAAPRHNEVMQQVFGAYVRLRHEQHLEILPERVGMLTVGVVLTPRMVGRRAWGTTVLATRDRDRLDDDYRALLEELWGTLGESRQI